MSLNVQPWLRLWHNFWLSEPFGLDIADLVCYPFSWNSAWYCCNLSVGIALNVWSTTNGMCTKNNTIYMWCEQAIIEWPRHVNSIVACCHSTKLHAHATQAFRLQQNGAVTRMWRSCRVKPSQKEHTIGAVRCKKEGMLLQPLRWHCAECVVHHKRNVCEEQYIQYMWHEQATREWSRHVNSIVAFFNSAKLCAHAAQAFRSQQYIICFIWK